MTEKELRAFSAQNHKKACLHFWPELNGKVLKGWVLHHKDPTLKYIDKNRYAEWNIEDLEPLTISAHATLHLISRPGNFLGKAKNLKDRLKVTHLTDAEKLKISLATKEGMAKPETKEKIRKNFEKRSKLFTGLVYWHRGNENKRSRECPGIGWERGKAKLNRPISETTRLKLKEKALLREARKKAMKLAEQATRGE